MLELTKYDWSNSKIGSNFVMDSDSIIFPIKPNEFNDSFLKTNSVGNAPPSTRY